MSGPWENVFGKTKLLDIAESLEKRMLKDFYFRIIDGNTSMNRVSDFQSLSLRTRLWLRVLNLFGVLVDPVRDVS